MKKDLLYLLSDSYDLPNEVEKADLSMENIKEIPLPESTQKRVDNILRYAYFQLILDNSQRTGSYLLN